MKIKFLLGFLLLTILVFSCKEVNNESNNTETTVVESDNNFNYKVEQFADLKILRYQISGWVFC